MNKIIATLDNISWKVLLIINICFGIFVGLAHGSALALSNIIPDYNADFIHQIATYSLPMVSIIFLSSIVGFIYKNAILSILKIHSIIILFVCSYGLFWSLSLIFVKFPKGNFSWTPGMLTVLMAYSVYLLRRSWLSQFIESIRIIRFMHIIIFFIVLPIDLTVFTKFISRLITGEQL